MLYLGFVRRSIAVLLLSLSLVACDKAEIKLSEIGSIPVSDAAYIFQREGNRSESDEEDLGGVWKVTLNGDEVKLKVLDTEGKETDLEIYSVENILENYLIVYTERSHVLLVDKTTNKVYECPEALTRAYIRIEEYPTGTIYYITGNGKIHKTLISSQSVIDEQLLPEGQYGFDFLLGRNGMIYYTGNDCYHGGGKIMTNSKRLYPTNEISCFMFTTADHEIYSIEYINREENNGHDIEYFTDLYIYQWESVSNNEIEKKLVVSGMSVEGFANIAPFIPINTTNNKVAIFIYNSHDFGVYEFDGKSCVLKRSYGLDVYEEVIDRLFDHILYLPNVGKGIYKTMGKTNVYFQHNPDGTGFNKDIGVSVNPITYEIKEIPYEIPEDQYEVYGTRTDASWGKMLFTALRYSDGSIVLGEVDAKGNVNIVSERASTYHITEYFALN